MPFLQSNRIRLCIPPIVLCIVDQTITLFGQRSAYWEGHYEKALEGSPPFYWLLTHHPLAFEAGIAVWIVLFSAAILFSPRWLAMAISLAIVIGHTWGTTTWLYLLFGQGYWFCIALFFASGVLSSLCYQGRVECPRDGKPTK